MAIIYYEIKHFEMKWALYLVSLNTQDWSNFVVLHMHSKSGIVHGRLSECMAIW